MFIIELTYQVPLAQIDAAMQAHMAWLNGHYAAGTFLASGRKVPRDGGIILAIGERAELEALAQRDPFVTQGLATARVIEFRLSQLADDAGDRLRQARKANA